MINTAQDLKEYKKRLKKALDNKFLRTAMGSFATAYKEAQGRLLAGMDVPALTREIAAGKDAALPRLDCAAKSSSGSTRRERMRSIPTPGTSTSSRFLSSSASIS